MSTNVPRMHTTVRLTPVALTAWDHIIARVNPDILAMVKRVKVGLLIPYSQGRTSGAAFNGGADISSEL